MDSQQAVTKSPFAMFVENIFFIKGRGTIVTGQVVRGTIKTGDDAFLVRENGFNKAVRVTRIEVFKKVLDEAIAPWYVSLYIQGADKAEVRPGDIVQSTPTERIFDPEAPPCSALGCHCPRSSPGVFCDGHNQQSLNGKEFPLKAGIAANPAGTAAKQKNDTQPEDGKRIGLGARIGNFIAFLFLFGGPICCFWAFFFAPFREQRTMANEFGQTASIVVVIILLAMAKEFLPKGLGALGAAFQKSSRPIHECAERGDTAGVKAQLSAGANPNSRDRYGATALQIASYKGYSSVVAVLLAAGADVGAVDKLGETALHKAAVRRRRAPEDQAADQSKNVAELLLANHAEVNAKCKKGYTPLHKAANEGRKDVAELLVVSNADVNARGDRGMTPLHFAAQQGYKDVAELLLANKAAVNAADKEGATALHWAVIKGHKDVAELLLANKAEVNSKTNDGDTPLHGAAAKGYKDVAELLRQHGGHE